MSESLRDKIARLLNLQNGGKYRHDSPEVLKIVTKIDRQKGYKEGIDKDSDEKKLLDFLLHNPDNDT